MKSILEGRCKVVKKRSWVNNLSMVTQLGITIITPILICTFIGVFIDEMLHKTPIVTIILLLVGVLAGFRNLFYFTMKQAKKNEKEDKHE